MINSIIPLVAEMLGLVIRLAEREGTPEVVLDVLASIQSALEADNVLLDGLQDVTDDLKKIVSEDRDPTDEEIEELRVRASTAYERARSIARNLGLPGD